MKYFIYQFIIFQVNDCKLIQILILFIIQINHYIILFKLIMQFQLINHNYLFMIM